MDYMNILITNYRVHMNYISKVMHMDYTSMLTISYRVHINFVNNDLITHTFYKLKGEHELYK